MESSVSTRKDKKWVLKRISWIKKNIIEPETRHSVVITVYGIIALIIMLHHVWGTLYFPKVYTRIAVDPIPFVLFALVSIILGKLWKDKLFCLFMALLLFRFFRNIILYGDLSQIPVTGFYFIGGCYAIGRIFTGEDRRKFLVAFCAAWTIAMVYYSCLCIHVAWTGNEIPNWANNSIRMGYAGTYRLYPIYHPVQAAVLACSSLAVVIVGYFSVKNKIWKAFFAASTIPVLILGILTASRVFHIVNSFLLSTLLFILLSAEIKKPPKSVRMIMLALAWMASFFLFIYLHSFGIRIFNFAKTGRGSLISAALADEGIALDVRNINLSGGLDGFLNGRVEIWLSIFQVLKGNPWLLLWGGSSNDAFRIVRDYRSSMGMPSRAHAHNTWIQVLLEDGIPGLLLYLLFTARLCFHGCRLVFNDACETWQRLLFFPAAACLIGDLVDITSYFNTGHPQVTLMFLFAGMAVAVSRETTARSKQKTVQCIGSDRYELQ